jgi:hypothetical protein
VSEAVAERAPLPTGTVTFLFSDIEGSTERWERHRDAMKSAVAKHDQLGKDELSHLSAEGATMAEEQAYEQAQRV